MKEDTETQIEMCLDDISPEEWEVILAIVKKEKTIFRKQMRKEVKKFCRRMRKELKPFEGKTFNGDVFSHEYLIPNTVVDAVYFLLNRDLIREIYIKGYESDVDSFKS